VQIKAAALLEHPGPWPFPDAHRIPRQADHRIDLALYKLDEIQQPAELGEEA